MGLSSELGQNQKESVGSQGKGSCPHKNQYPSLLHSWFVSPTQSRIEPHVKNITQSPAIFSEFVTLTRLVNKLVSLINNWEQFSRFSGKVELNLGDEASDSRQLSFLPKETWQKQRCQFALKSNSIAAPLSFFHSNIIHIHLFLSSLSNISWYYSSIFYSSLYFYLYFGVFHLCFVTI